MSYILKMILPLKKKKKCSEKSDILLVPPIINSYYSGNFGDFQPLGLLALAASLKKQGYQPQIYTPWKRMIDEEDYFEVASEILAYHAELIGFSTWCITYPASILIAKQLKYLRPGVSIIFGGPQATLVGTETLKEFKFIDYILKGECDYTLPELVRILQNGHEESKLLNISGLAFRSGNGNIVQNKMKGPLSCLDELPVPAYEHLSGSTSLRLDAGRGCPFKCTYCTTSDFFSKKYRTKSVERIIGEMNLAFHEYSIREFSFAHDMFTLKKSFVEELCQRLISLNLERGNRRFSWTCSARIDCVTEDLLKLMKEAGCSAIFFGIESGSEKIQHSIKKNLILADVYKIADICRSLGIDMFASFIMGFPDETEDDIEKTLRCIFILSTHGIFTQISELALLPGTPLYNLHKEKLKFDGRVSNFSDCFCGLEEFGLIMKYPEIFSSFYQLPVAAIDRESLYLLRNLINNLSEFRNTLFLLRNFLMKDLEHISLIELFRKSLKDLKEQKDSPMVVFLVKRVKEYLATKKNSGIHPCIYDVFAYESTVALMLAKYVRWKLIQPEKEKRFQRKPPEDMKVSMQPTPYWQLLTTSFDINSILPSKICWNTENFTPRKGNYHYLIVAVSEKFCNSIKITRKENIVLKKLAGDMSGKSTDGIKSVTKGIEINPFWKRMKKLGVVEFKN
jgi:radical SAM superfamily enzyme YgiQ (UPF0313 family)